MRSRCGANLHDSWSIRNSELSNTLAEELNVRPVALGWKNWIHIGSPQAGPEGYGVISRSVESCRKLKLPVRDYMAAALPGFADLPFQLSSASLDLTPAAWVAQHS